MMKKRAASLLLTLVCLALLVPAASAASFPDVPNGHWAYQEIEDMAARGVIQGSGGKFYPTGEVSRQAFLSMVCRATGLDDKTLEPGSDWWQPSQAYAHYVGWCSETEIHEGNRSQPISRELAAKLLVKAFFPDSVPAAGAPDYSDWKQVGLPYRSDVRIAAELGLMGGYDDGTFRPQGTLTRAAAAAIISRALALQEQSAGKSVQIPILMYHDVSDLGHGYSKTPEVFRRQMTELLEAGFHTVSFAQVMDFVDHGTTLPEKPIVITFDDGYLTNYTEVFPILQELGIHVEISVIGNAIQYANWGMEWDHVREMQESGLVSFQAHTNALHDAAGRTGILKKAEESWADYVATFGADTRTIIARLKQETGQRPQVFTYPLGKHNPVAEAMVRHMGFRASLTTLDGIAKVRHGDRSSLYLMNRIGMDFRNGSVVETLKQFGYSS